MTGQTEEREKHSKLTLYSPDITCNSCIKILNTVFEQTEGINAFSISEKKIELEIDPTKVTEEEIIARIQKKGYRASQLPITKRTTTIRERVKDFFTNKDKYHLEYQMIRYTIWTFLLLTVLELVAYVTFSNNLTELKTFGPWMIYLNIAVVTLGAAIWHFNAHKTEIPCMVGMMAGMTIGMQTGLMLGTIIGATNGMLMGSVIGVIAGVIIGAKNGSCCGIMGIMEGMMAGVMGGTMGPMIGVMLKYDHILWFMPLFTIVNILILWGLAYLLYEEVVEDSHVEKKPLSMFTFASYCIITTAILMLIMLYGYRSSLGITI